MDTTNLLERLEPLHADAFGWARHCCSGDAHAAEEVLQTAYLRAAEGRAKFGEQSALKTWWLGVIRLTAMESRRRAAWRLQRLVDWFHNNAPAESTSHREDAALPGDVEAHQLDALLAQLSARQRRSARPDAPCSVEHRLRLDDPGDQRSASQSSRLLRSHAPQRCGTCDPISHPKRRFAHSACGIITRNWVSSSWV